IVRNHPGESRPFPDYELSVKMIDSSTLRPPLRFLTGVYSIRRVSVFNTQPPNDFSERIKGSS
ncbi:MAG: hypothetical protein O3B86_20405, partial [Planctomycetota bacterium]|nr:hypothetical protein [Planctomycetota bacterium]